ncbi:hypothetical protein SH584_00220 [Sphingomonas sp. LY29]|nr:hypothetical protein [Sphingomonas sp. LY29]WRP25913.1 hypothetical protein SH584_00220 [Sphingomonas sp. LY29]
MSIVAILIALVAAFLVFKFVTGTIKFVVLALIVIAAIYFVSGGLGA